MEEFILIEPSLEYKEDVISFLEEVKIVDRETRWQYAGMSRLEQSNTYEEWFKKN